MKPVETLGANGEGVDLYLDVDLSAFRKSIMFIPVKELVDLFSIGVASQIVNDGQNPVYLTEVNSPDSDLHGVKAFAINLERDTADYYEANRKERRTNEEYDLAKQKLVSAVSKLFEAKEQFVRNSLSRL